MFDYRNENNKANVDSAEITSLEIADNITTEEFDRGGLLVRIFQIYQKLYIGSPYLTQKL